MSSAKCPRFRVSELNLANSTPLGAGAISQVVRSTLSGPTPVPIAVKIISKVQVLQQQKVNSVMNEKAALVRLHPHPFIGRLLGTSQSEDELYFVLEWLPHGDLLQHIRRTAAQCVRDYTAHATRSTGEAASGLTDAEAGLPCSTHDDEPEANTNDRGTADLSTAPDATLHDLDDRVAEEGLIAIPPSSTARRALDFHDIQLITAQLVLALAHVAQHGLVLRDLKPENIAFDDHYRACLIDFDTVDLEGGSKKPQSLAHAQPGVSSSPCSSSSSSSTPDALPVDRSRSRSRRLTVSAIRAMRARTAQFCGTAQYVSPEMVCRCCWSFSSDLWSLGTVVYEMMYGVHMFAGAAAYEVLRKVMRGVGGSASHALSTQCTPNETSRENKELRDCQDAEPTGARSQRTRQEKNDVAFPVVDLGAEHDAFARVKDFIIRLMHMDPRKRLGVRADTLCFDLAVIQAHSLFDDFDWAVLESHLHRRNALVFDPSSSSSCRQPQAPSAVTRSLQSHYHIVPHNDDKYAEYVYHATADANPFERFMKHIRMSEEEPKQTKLAASSSSVAVSKQNAVATLGVDNTAEQNTLLHSPARAGTGATCRDTQHTRCVCEEDREDGGHDSEDDVIDDVGVQYEVNTFTGAFS